MKALNNLDKEKIISIVIVGKRYHAANCQTFFSSQAFLTVKRNDKPEIIKIYIKGTGGNNQYIYDMFKYIGLTKDDLYKYRIAFTDTVSDVQRKKDL